MRTETQARVDKTCMSYWFPKLFAAGLPVPTTHLLSMPQEAFRDVFRVFDGERTVGDLEAFALQVKDVADRIGYPCFLRTGQTSGKHDWENTCHIPDAESIAQHIINIVEFSECVQMIGLDCSVWAVRELLPTLPLGVAPRFGNMPLCREFRFFVSGGEVGCWHPYWPLKALEQARADVSLYDQLASTEGYELALGLAQKTTLAIEGAWSVDVLETQRGWYVTDMAEAEKSFHWEGCDNA